MTVIDTSAIVDFLLGTGVAPAVQELLERERELAAPDLLVFEVLAVLRREASRGLDDRRASGAVHDLGDLRVTLFPSIVLRERAWELHRNFTVADAIFVTLAERLREPLATKDLALAREATKHTAAPVVTLTG